MQHRMSWPYRLSILGVAIVFSLPILLGLFTGGHKSRSSAENRALQPWPETRRCLSDPKAYLLDFQEYLKDRMRFVVAATTVYNRFLFDTLDISPSKRISINRPYLFFTRHGETQPPFYNLNNVGKLADAAAMEKLKENLELLRMEVAAPNRRIGFAIVPSKPAIYADRLPPDTPTDIRRNCQQVMKGDHLLQPLEFGKMGLSLVYPLDDMVAQRDTPHFFPPEQFHIAGKSAHLMARKTIAAMGIEISDDYAVTPVLSTKVIDLKRALGFEATLNYWDYDYSKKFGLKREEQRPQEVKQYHTRASEFRRFRCSYPMTQRRSLLIGNSFGGPLSFHLAPAYREMVFVSFNGITKADMARFREYIDVYDPDDIIFVFHDGGLHEWMINRMIQSWKLASR